MLDVNSFDSQVFVLFKPLFDESENITIECTEYKFVYDGDEHFDINIKSFNGFQSWNDLKDKLTTIYKSIFSVIKEILKTLPTDVKLKLLENTRNLLVSYRDINIVTGSYHFKGSEYGPDEDNDYIFIPNANYSVLRDDVPVKVTKYIHYKISYFAETFSVVYNEIIAKLEFLINNIELIPEASQFQDMQVITPKLKTSLSVSELAYLFKILKDEEIIIVPKGQAESFYRLIADTFSSKQKDAISPDTFKNKFLEPLDSAIEYWHIKFADIIQRVKKDRGKI